MAKLRVSKLPIRVQKRRCCSMAKRLLLRASGVTLRCVLDVNTNPLVAGLVTLRVQSRPPLCDNACSLIRQLNTPVPRIRLKKDRPLDAVASMEKDLRPIIQIRDVILKFKRKAIPFRFVTIRRRELGLKMSDAKVEQLMRRYPNIFEFFEHPDENLPWCKLAPQAMQLVEEEKRIYAELEPIVVEKLRKLLMLSRDHRIRANKLVVASRFFGFPDSVLTTVVPKYPQYFRLLQNGQPFQTLELVAWDESLAITEFERKAKANAKEMGLGDIETRGRPLAFKFQYSPGMQLKKKVIEHYNKWQRLPYICPYQKADWVEGTPLDDKRMVALLHEILSLTIGKKILIEVIGHFRDEFNLPQNVAKVFNRYPGVFYISLKGAVHTIYLREGYHKRQLLEEHPLLSLKAKYHKMLIDGPRLRSIQSRARRSGKNANAVLDHERYGAEESKDQGSTSDEAESVDEFEFSDSEVEERNPL